ncbi:MAG: methyl-accepting chemotaxis protein [Eubacteriales bacterium]|nr:methyl-accepting chemotaxis protein [Eubacteriales bacterium]
MEENKVQSMETPVDVISIELDTPDKDENKKSVKAKKPKKAKAPKQPKAPKSPKTPKTPKAKKIQNAGVNSEGQNQTKNKNRRFGIKFKMLVPSIAVIVLICVSLGTILSFRMKTSLIETAGEAAISTANNIASNVTVDNVSELISKNARATCYTPISNTFKSEMKEGKMKYVYLLQVKDDKLTYLIDPNAGDKAIGTEFELTAAELPQVMQGNDYAENKITKSDGSSLISAYVPIMSGGKVIAILGCDYDASSISTKINNNSFLSIIITVICVVIAVSILSVLINSIVGNLIKVNGKVYELASNEGDLTQVIDVNSGDETELIAQNMNKLLAYIRDIMLNISKNADELNVSSGVVVDNLRGAKDNVNDVSATMEEMSASMEETTASIGQINESIVDVCNSIEEVNSKAMAGNDSAKATQIKAEEIRQKAVKASLDAKQKSKEMAEAVSDKIEKSKAVSEIGHLTDDIIEITEQTNLLALNASIEAARAGEAGRGFVVVAEEIGKLANNSANVASQIQSISEQVINAVDELAKEAQIMIEFMDTTAMSGYKELESTSEAYSNDASGFHETMEHFTEQSKKLQANIDAIGQAIEAVNIAAEETAKGIVNVTQMSVELSVSINEIGEKAENNRTISDELNSQVGKFKLQ